VTEDLVKSRSVGWIYLQHCPNKLYDACIKVVTFGEFLPAFPFVDFDVFKKLLAEELGIAFVKSA